MSRYAMKVEYVNERLIESSETGKTLLDLALGAKIPHAHECGVGASILVSDDAKAHLGSQFAFRRSFNARLKGKTGLYRLHEVQCN